MIKTEHVMLFTGEFNQEIHDELKRVKRTLWASLDLWQISEQEKSNQSAECEESNQ
jgi:hypothetical protein